MLFLSSNISTTFHPRWSCSSCICFLLGMTGPRLLEVLEITPGTFSASRHGTRSWDSWRRHGCLCLFFFFFAKIVFTVHSGLVVGIVFSLHVLCVLALIIANATPGHISFVSMLLMVSVMIIVIFLLLTGWDTPISHTAFPLPLRIFDILS